MSSDQTSAGRPSPVDPSALDQSAESLGMGGDLAPEKDADAYRKRMARRQDVQRQRVSERSVEKGLVLVFTGHGKGKTTASLGLALRTLGHGHQVAVLDRKDVLMSGGSYTLEAGKTVSRVGEAAVTMDSAIQMR